MVGVRVPEKVVGNTTCAFIIVLVRIIIRSKEKPVYLNEKLYILIFTRIS
jgi:hypothetical protein